MSGTVDAPEAAQGQQQQGQPKIEVKVTPQGPATKPFGQKAKGDVDELLSALATRTKETWSVERLSAKGYPRATLGVLEVDVTGDDIRGGRLHQKLGSGTYKLVNRADPKEQHIIPLATQTPPQEFGTPAEDEDEEVVFVMPDGRPATGKVKRGAQVPPIVPPPYPGGWGHGAWAQPQQQGDPALKAMLEVQMKVLEKIADKITEKRDDGPDAKTLIEIEKMKLEGVKAEAAARAAEAKAAAEVRIAELKAKSESDRQTALDLARIQSEGQKAVAEAQARQALAFSEAQKEAARQSLEAAKANAQAMVDAARAKADGEKGMFERLIKMQEESRPAAPPSLLDQIGELEQLKKLGVFGAPASDGIVSGIGAVKDAAVSIIGNLIALRQTPVKYIMVDKDGNPVSTTVTSAAVVPAAQAAPPALPAPAAAALVNPTPSATLAPAAAAALLNGSAAAPPAPGAVPANAEEKAKVDEASALARQVMDGLRSLEDGAKKQVDPARMADLIRERLPKVYEWLRNTSPDAIMGEIQAMVEQPIFTLAEKNAALACRATLAGDLVWLLNVLAAVKA